jgi:hypothetical protein
MDKAPSTVSREVAVSDGRDDYRAWSATFVRRSNLAARNQPR